ncbi:MAG TPA: hypothetical protein VFU59_07660, partial [Candidatus Eisenbacteria bacterium]|nr:hypothetical protein [Candidatus Eisenbacteria bacterium]
ATLGAALVVPLMNVVPTPMIVALAGILPLLAAVVVTRRAAVPAAVLALAIVGLAIWQEPFRLHYTKEYAETRDVLYERWTPTARITVFPKLFFAKTQGNAFGWGLGLRYAPRPIEQMWIEQDGSAGTPITRLDGATGEDALQALRGPGFDHLDFDVTSVAYAFSPPRRVCVIGAGGGRDILCALRAGATDVDAVELNPGIVDAVSRPFGEFSGHVYNLPGVHPVVSEGRSFLTHSKGGYDLLQISLIDSWAATAAGAFALSENYLYTTEALQLYWRRLSDHGVLSISRYATGERANEIVRIARLALHALEREGVQEPWRYMGLAVSRDVGTLLITRDPFDADRLVRFAKVCFDRGIRREWPMAEGEPTGPIASRLTDSGERQTAAEGFSLEPPTDDRPFFFQMMPVLGGPGHAAPAAKLSANENSVLLLRSLLYLMSGLAVVLFLAPFLVRRSIGGGPMLWRGSLYFIAIGIAFMLVEVPWIQRFILYLGHPSYATTVVLATLLLTAGLGSLVAARVDPATVRRFSPLLPLAIVAVNLAAGPAFAATLGASLPGRIGASVALLALPGFFMGFAFPSGMMRFGADRTAWFWAMNGIASVVASVVALALTMTFGLTTTVFIGVVAYVIAVLLLTMPSREPRAAK